MPSGGRETGVEIVGDNPRLQDGDVRAGRLQMRVNGVAHLVVGPRLGEVDMRYLGGRVDAGVGAAGGAQPHRLAAEFLDRLLYRLLHRRLIRLVLPAGEEAAVIFDIETKTRHTLAV